MNYIVKNNGSVIGRFDHFVSAAKHAIGAARAGRCVSIAGGDCIRIINGLECLHVRGAHIPGPKWAGPCHESSHAGVIY